MNLDVLKPAPIMDTVRFKSTPPGAEAKTSTGQTCRTPCALALPTNAPMTVTFTLNGYLPDSEDLDPVSATTGVPEFHPNPVQVELMPAPPPPKPVKKPARAKKKPTAKPAVKPMSKPKARRRPRPCGSSASAAASPGAVAGARRRQGSNAVSACC